MSKIARYIFGLALFGAAAAADAIEPDSLTTRAFHRFSTAITLSPISVPIPLGFGANLYYIKDARWLIGADVTYSQSTFGFLSSDLDEVHDTHIALQALYFFGNSFHARFAVGQRYTHMRLARKLFNPAASGPRQTESILESQFVRIGFGNLWHYSNKYSFGLNWLNFNFPVSGATTRSAAGNALNANDMKSIADNETIIRYFPSATFLQMELGLVF